MPIWETTRYKNKRPSSRTIYLMVGRVGFEPTVFLSGGFTDLCNRQLCIPTHNGRPSGIRTQNILILNQTRLPIAPRTHKLSTENSILKNCRKHNKLLVLQTKIPPTRNRWDFHNSNISTEIIAVAIRTLAQTAKRILQSGNAATAFILN